MNNINDIIELVNQAEKINKDITISKGMYCVDCKSLTGVFSLDLSTGVTLEYPEDAIEFDDFVSKFII